MVLVGGLTLVVDGFCLELSWDDGAAFQHFSYILSSLVAHNKLSSQHFTKSRNFTFLKVLVHSLDSLKYSKSLTSGKID